MRVLVENKKLQGVINPPEYKSITQRYLICQALTSERTQVNYFSNPSAVETLADCLKELGLPAILKRRDLAEQVGRIECGNHYDTFRLLLPIAAVIGRPCEFFLKEELMNEPIEGILKALKIHGIKHEYVNRNTMSIWGKLTAGTFIIPGKTCSQFVSGLLFALPLLTEPSTLIIQGNLEEKDDIFLTLEVLEECGIKIETVISDVQEMPGAFSERRNSNSIGATFKISGGQRYHFRGMKLIEGDWIYAAFMLAAAGVCGNDVTITGMNPDSRQIERTFLEILENAGVNVKTKLHKYDDTYEATHNAAVAVNDVLFGKIGEKTLYDIKIKGQNMVCVKAFEIDSEGLENLLLPLIILASGAKGISIIKNVCNAEKYIELAQELEVNIWENEDNLYIEGFSGFQPLNGGKIDCQGDWKKALFGLAASYISSGPVEIEGSEYLNEQYPGLL